MTSLAHTKNPRLFRCVMPTDQVTVPSSPINHGPHNLIKNYGILFSPWSLPHLPPSFAYAHRLISIAWYQPHTSKLSQKLAEFTMSAWYLFCYIPIAFKSSITHLRLCLAESHIVTFDFFNWLCLPETRSTYSGNPRFFMRGIHLAL